MKIGSLYLEDFIISQDEVNAFADISGDKNPIHLDADYAAKTVFRKPIIHGFLASSRFSKVLGMNFPGEGTIYLSQEMRFIKPMYVEKSYTVKLTVIETIPEKMRVKIETQIIDKYSNEPVIIGHALVQNPNIKFE